MDVIRSNYSTLGPLAQREAPKPPEYPYTEIMNAYRGAFEANVEEETNEPGYFDGNGNYTTSSNGISSLSKSIQNHTHTKAFQRILNHFFGDYFTIDVDEELASDMVERWSSFARDGIPNYDASKTEWLPWRYRPKEDPISRTQTSHTSLEYNDNNINTRPRANEFENGGMENDFWETGGEYDEFTNAEETDDISDLDDIDEIEGMKIDEEYRKRALEALELAVADKDDVFRTELRHVQSRDGEHLVSSNLLFRTFGWGFDDKHDKLGGRSKLEILRLARRMGVIGIGLASGHDDSSKFFSDNPSEEDYFPQLLELSWPPELRLIEEDCTCDMWDRIRCKFCNIYFFISLGLFVIHSVIKSNNAL